MTRCRLSGLSQLISLNLAVVPCRLRQPSLAATPGLLETLGCCRLQLWPSSRLPPWPLLLLQLPCSRARALWTLALPSLP